MDLFKIIQDLREEKRRIERAITAIEELATGKAALFEEPRAQAPPAKKRRGRPRKSPGTPSIS